VSRRHRRREREEPASAKVDPIPITINGTVTPTSPEMSRPGLDAEVIVAIQWLDRLIKEMRDGLAYPSAPEDEESAVKRYLLYTSMLIDSVLPDIIMSAIAEHDVMVQVKQRMLLEYAAKATYYDDHPDYALYMMTVCEAASIHRKFEKANSNPTAIASASAHLEEMKKKFPVPKGMAERTFEMIFSEYAGPDDYVWLYGAPSAIMHGDPEGMRALLEQMPDGSQVPRLVFELDHVNAMLVDAGRNTLLFCDRFVDRFRPGEEKFIKRVKSLHATFLRLILKHPDGRNEEILDTVRMELKELEATL
jgi:hypothetical protein